MSMSIWCHSYVISTVCTRHFLLCNWQPKIYYAHSLWFRRQQEVGEPAHSFHSIPDFPSLRPASVQSFLAKGPQTRPETRAGFSNGRPRHRGPGAHSGCNHPSPDRTCLPTGRSAYLSPVPSATAHSDWQSHAGLTVGETRPHSRGQSWSSDRLVLQLLQKSGACWPLRKR